MIEYDWSGPMKVDGQEYRGDLKILRNRVKENWWRKEGHRVDVQDVKDILSAEPEVLVIGTGYAGNMRVEENLRSALEDHNIKLVVKNTMEAVEAFNSRHSKGEDVAGAFHLTC